MTRLAIRNPRTGAADHHIELPDAAMLDALCQELRHGQRAWQARSLEERVTVLRAWLAALRGHPGVLPALRADTGRRAESELERTAVLASIERWCSQVSSLVPGSEPRPSSLPFVEIRQGAQAHALVGVISPWNFPLLLSLIDAIPALLAGCAVVIKPSEVTPRFIESLAETIAQVPELATVLRYVPGDGTTGAALVDRVDLVCFTGSVVTGRRIAEQCARRLIPAYLELGGKDPAIVTSSADLERATSALLWGSAVNAGQSCLSIERIYVAEACYEPFLDLLVAKARSLGLAYPDDDSGPIGPIIAARQVEVLREHLRDARARGARVRTGGEILELGGGLYCQPTVLTEVDHDMLVMREESFGPLMPVMPFTDLDHAVALANDSSYGLSAAVFAGTSDEALAVARRLEAGAVSINDAGLTAMVHDAEKHAFKHSGLGPSRMGPAALQRFWRRQAFLVHAGSGRDPWWF